MKKLHLTKFKSYTPITGKRWLDRNLGQTCTSSTRFCYGDGEADGHEKSNLL